MENGRNSYYFTDNSREDLKEKIEWLLNDKAKIREMGRYGHKIRYYEGRTPVKKKFSYILDRHDKKMVALLMVMAIIGSVLELCGVSIFMPFVNIIMMPNYIQNNPVLNWTYELGGFTSTKGYEIFLCVVIIVIYIVKNIYLIIQKNVTYKFSFRIQKELATKLLNSYMKQPYTFHLRKNVAELQRALQEDVANFSQFVMQTMELVAEVSVCALIGIYLLDVSKTITIVVLGLLCICVYGFAMGTKRFSTSLGRECQIYKTKVYQWINQSMGGIKEVKILNREQYFLDSYSTYYVKYTKALQILRLLSMIPKYIVEAVCMTGLVLAIIIKIAVGKADIIFFIPQLTVFATASFRLLPSVGRVNGYLTQMLAAMPSIDLVYHDLKEVENYEAAQQSVDAVSFTFREQIQVQNVTYRYPDGVEDIVNNVSFTIRKGETVGFIGPSGAGKTTMVDIILGLLTPVEGHILVDDVDIHRNIDCWHRQIGYIPQTIYLADDTIRANIAFGVFEDQIDDDAVNRALRQAKLDEFVNTLPQGVNTCIGDRGVRLSGGQRQRIGIARALYHDPEILVLDEATSALDNETETAVMESINSLQGMKTMIIIAHRYTTIRNADFIYEVADGCVVRRQKQEIFGNGA